jgi:hypothetical protein
MQLKVKLLGKDLKGESVAPSLSTGKQAPSLVSGTDAQHLAIFASDAGKEANRGTQVLLPISGSSAKSLTVRA